MIKVYFTKCSTVILCSAQLHAVCALLLVHVDTVLIMYFGDAANCENLLV
jgi:hypothetical protein